jgi:uncharacterized protein YycO
MRKAHLVSTPKIGDYGLVDVGKFGPLASPLALISGWRFDHGFIYVGQGQIVEAWYPLARQRPLSQYPDAIFYSVDPTQRERCDIAKWATEQVDRRPYDIYALPPLSLFKMLTGIDLSFLLHYDPMLNCTPLIAYAYRAAGIELTNRRDLHLVTPDELDFDRTR